MTEPQDNLYPPLDESDDGPLRIDTRFVSPTPPTPLPSDQGTPNDPDGLGHRPPARPTPWDLTTPRMEDILGTGDGWTGEVVTTYDAAGDNEHGQAGVIVVRRTGTHWKDDVLYLGEIPPAQGQPQPSYYKAYPFPVIDQEAYRTAEGDAVIVIGGKDGRLYYLPDDKPFVGEVEQLYDTTDTEESNFGGAGGATQSITVRRVLMTGDPTADGYTFDADKTTVLYNYVRVLAPGGQHHGHRYGSKVLCFRRGAYMYALPHRGLYHGEVVEAGPDGEDNFTTHHYWISLKAYGVAWGDEENDWIWDAEHDSDLFIVDAANLVEKADNTHLLATGTEVVVYVHAGDDHAPYWAFLREPSITAKIPDALCIDATYSPLDPTGALPAWSHMGGAVNRTGAILAGGGVTNISQSYVTGQMYLDANGDYNPWMVIDLSSYPKTTDFCTNGTPAGTTNLTDAAGTYYITGHMYTDGEGKLNPWVRFNMPSDYPKTTDFCTNGSPAGTTDLTSDSGTYYITGHMYTDGEGKLNPWVRFNLPAANTYLTLADDDTWIEASIAGNTITVIHIGPDLAGTHYYNDIGHCGFRTDLKGHVIGWYKANDTWYSGPGFADPGPWTP